MPELRPPLAALLIAAFGLAHTQSQALGFALLFAAFGLIFLDLWRLPNDRILDWLGLRAGNKRAPQWLLIALVGSLALGVFYRSSQGLDWSLVRLTPFVLTAMLIGSTEEVVFRGYFWGAYAQLPARAIGFSALAHTAYKSAIFIPYPEISLWRLSLFTFLAGILLGYMRWAGKSIWPCILFHAVFDLWAYGDHFTPWWVWQ